MDKIYEPYLSHNSSDPLDVASLAKSELVVAQATLDMFSCLCLDMSAYFEQIYSVKWEGFSLAMVASVCGL